MSHSMFVRTVFKVIELFDQIVELKFANLSLKSGTFH